MAAATGPQIATTSGCISQLAAQTPHGTSRALCSVSSGTVPPFRRPVARGRRRDVTTAAAVGGPRRCRQVPCAAVSLHRPPLSPINSSGIGSAALSDQQPPPPAVCISTPVSLQLGCPPISGRSNHGLIVSNRTAAVGSDNGAEQRRRGRCRRGRLRYRGGPNPAGHGSSDSSHERHVPLSPSTTSSADD